MVMEAPSPQCVGLEFVRQYYTILNKAPGQLHRFYAVNSSFMHGGENSNRENIVGQTDIHKHIQDMNFKDCHAKILLIDSQATLENGVVIQVTGELSNDGRPMRRFMQTFVLAPQSEKKYYVHNDIFRYQDQVFNDGDEDEGPEDSLQDNGHSEDLQPQLAHQEVVQSAAVPPPVLETSVTTGPGVPPGVGMAVQQQVVAEYPGVGSTSHHQTAAVIPQPVAAVHAAPQQQMLSSSQQPSQVAPSAVLPPQQQQAPQQQQLNGNIASVQDVTAAVAALSVAPLGGPSAHPILPHTSAPGVANLNALERGAGINKGQVQQHFAQQSVASAPAQPTPSQPQIIDSNNMVQSSNQSLPQNSRDDSWGTTDEWSLNNQNDTWVEEGSSAPSQPLAQQQAAPRQQQQLGSSRSSAASPPTKLPEKKVESPSQHHQASVQPQQPRSYAAFFKSSSGPGSLAQQPSLPVSQHSQYQSRDMGSRSNNQQQQQQSSQREREREGQPASHPRDRDQQQSRGGDRENSGGFVRAGRGGRAVNNYRNRTSNYSESGSDRHNANAEENGNAMESSYGGGRLDDRRRGPPQMSAPDSHQIFVGNLPTSVHETELREVFASYGVIQEIRINIGKGKLTGPTNGKPAGLVPNFGFVTFEDEQAVVNCLKSKPITINGDHRLNVEEKKTRSKMGGEGGGGGGGGGGGSGGYGGRPSNMRPPMHQQGGRGTFSRGDGGRGPRGAYTGPPRR